VIATATNTVIGSPITLSADLGDISIQPPPPGFVGIR
jgi:hypothetical protein